MIYAWPSRSQYGAVIPKAQIYEHGPVSTRTRARFVDEVRELRWSHKLSPRTTGLPASKAINEIEVIAVRAKGERVHPSVLEAIARAVPEPVVFEVISDVGIMTAMLNEDPRRTLLSADPDALDGTRTALPVAIDLASLVDALRLSLMPLAARRGENAEDLQRRLVRIDALSRRIAMLERRVRSALQLNRQMASRRELVAARVELATLMEEDEK
ncbi:hypothetical protein GCM10009846_26380 [Agrococcus versicolor]|uniref:DUF4391 domain-containing protein n=1 Tax=Agrococcus versicolor TaxID=501482 RepID=A0ABN3AW90_9MICO